METRPLGDTGQESTVLTFGAIALDFLDQPGANDLTETVLDRGVNHIDVAPGYGTAEVKLAPTLAERREGVFLGCKTLERGYEGAWEKLEESLDRLGTDHIGITSHGHPDVIREAFDRIPDLETAMFPVNATVAAKDDAAHDFRSLASELSDQGVGVLAIKTFAKQPWSDDILEDERPYNTWYEPYDDPAALGQSLRFTLAQDVDTLTNAGDPQLVDDILDAAASFDPMTEDEQAALIADRTSEESPVPADLG